MTSSADDDVRQAQIDALRLRLSQLLLAEGVTEARFGVPLSVFSPTLIEAVGSFLATVSDPGMERRALSCAGSMLTQMASLPMPNKAAERDRSGPLH